MTFFQESRLKVGKSLMATVAREVARSAPRRRLLKSYVDSMASVPELVEIKERRAVALARSDEQRTDAFLEAFEVANRRLFR